MFDLLMVFLRALTRSLFDELVFHGLVSVVDFIDFFNPVFVRQLI